MHTRGELRSEYTAVPGAPDLTARVLTFHVLKSRDKMHEGVMDSLIGPVTALCAPALYHDCKRMLPPA